MTVQCRVGSDAPLNTNSSGRPADPRRGQTCQTTCLTNDGEQDVTTANEPLLKRFVTCTKPYVGARGITHPDNPTSLGSPRSPRLKARTLVVLADGCLTEQVRFGECGHPGLVLGRRPTEFDGEQVVELRAEQRAKAFARALHGQSRS